MQKKQILMLIAATLANCAWAGQPAAQKQTPTIVAVFDFQGIVNFDDPTKSDSLEWRDIMTDLEKNLKPRLDKLQKKQEKLQKLAKELQGGRPDEDKVAEAAQLESSLKIEAQAYQNHSQKELQKVQGQFGEKVRLTVEKVAQQEGVDIVIPGPVLYVREKCDITKKVIERLNNDYRAEQRAKKFKADSGAKAAADDED